MITLTSYFSLRYFPSGEGNSRMRVSFKYTYYEKMSYKHVLFTHAIFYNREDIYYDIKSYYLQCDTSFRRCI